jgi:hypothetical protein
MAWSKFDDSFESNLKVRGVWFECGAAIGLYVMSVTFAAKQETDGMVPAWWVAGCFQKPKEMEVTVGALLDSGMWERHGDDFLIHDFLDFHSSKASRKADAERKKKEREERDGEASA